MALFLFRVPLTGQARGRSPSGRCCSSSRAPGSASWCPPSCAPRSPRSSAPPSSAIIPTILFSGMLVPVSALTGARARSWATASRRLVQPRERGDLHQGPGPCRPVARLPGAGGPSGWVLPARAGPAAHPGALSRAAHQRLPPGLKELISLRYDPVLVFLLVYAFTFAIIAPAATTVKLELRTPRSRWWTRTAPSSRRGCGRSCAHLLPAARRSARDEVDAAMDAGRFTFVIDLPPRFEADAGEGRRPRCR
jgi:hypothetical protein